MKKKWIVLFAIVLASVAGYFAYSPCSKLVSSILSDHAGKVIVIDPGHGGTSDRQRDFHEKE